MGLFKMPKRRALVVPGGRVASVRWGRFGWDHFAGDGFSYTQWGRAVPLHFVCRYDAEAGMPHFLLGVRFRRTAERPGYVAGYTNDPLEAAQIWRKIDAARAV